MSSFQEMIKKQFKEFPGDKDFVMMIARFNKKDHAKFFMLKNPEDEKEVGMVLHVLSHNGQKAHRKVWGKPL